MNSRLDYRADLDGLRAVAVVPGILFHLGPRSVPRGFVGVDVFLVCQAISSHCKSSVSFPKGDFRFWGFMIVASGGCSQR